MYHSFLIHSSADGHLGCFHVLAIINSAVMNTGIHVSFNSGFLSVYAQQWDCWVVMAPHYSTLAWKIPWTEEPGRLQFIPSLRVGHDWATLLSLFTFMHWRRKWKPTPVFLPGESQGWGSLLGCRLWGREEPDTTEAAQQQQQQQHGSSISSF